MTTEAPALVRELTPALAAEISREQEPAHRRANTLETSSALQGQAIFYLLARLDRFGTVFGELELILGVFRRPSRLQNEARIAELEGAR